MVGFVPKLLHDLDLFPGEVVQLVNQAVYLAVGNLYLAPEECSLVG
jgi:hypothetical protein